MVCCDILWYTVILCYTVIYCNIQSYMNIHQTVSYLTRHRVFGTLVGLCQSCGLPSSSEHPLLSLSSYPSFILGEVRGGLDMCYMLPQYNCCPFPPPPPASPSSSPSPPACPPPPCYGGATPGLLKSAERLHHHPSPYQRVATGGGPSGNG